jgi:hypothetical protein
VRVSTGVVCEKNAFHISNAMIRGNVASHNKDPKTWRERSRKKRKQPAIASAIVTTSAPKTQLKGPVIRLSEQQRANDNGNTDVGSDDATPQKRSAIVEPKRKTNSMLAHLLGDITDEERNRRADLADEMFRTIVRRANAPQRD